MVYVYAFETYYASSSNDLQGKMTFAVERTPAPIVEPSRLVPPSTSICFPDQIYCTVTSTILSWRGVPIAVVEEVEEVAVAHKYRVSEGVIALHVCISLKRTQ
jgi:hypothetical protein